jgi:catechol 2,3-dioxygenase-like lactoylglutathione lyase family enzyme
MLHHVEIYVSNLKVSRKFWKNLLANTGYKETGHWADGFTLSSSEFAYLTFVQVAEKYKSLQYHRCAVGLNHLAFRMPNKDAVDELRQFCIKNKIPILYDDKYPFANGGNKYYALYIEDPDRIKVEFVADD